jgi:hypothetical protein
MVHRVQRSNLANMTSAPNHAKPIQNLVWTHHLARSLRRVRFWMREFPGLKRLNLIKQRQRLRRPLVSRHRKAMPCLKLGLMPTSELLAPVGMTTMPLWTCTSTCFISGVPCHAFLVSERLMSRNMPTKLWLQFEQESPEVVPGLWRHREGGADAA